MLNSFDSELFKNAEISGCAKSDLVDLCNVRIDTDKAVPERMVDFLCQIKNPYLFKVGDMRVKVSFSTERSFTDALSAAILSGTNYRSNLS